MGERHKLQLRIPESVNAGSTEGLLEGLLPLHCATQSYAASPYHVLQLMEA